MDGKWGFGVVALATSLTAASLLGGVSCTVLLDHSSQQCQQDSDCHDFGHHPYCDPKTKVCVASGLCPKDCIFGTPTKPTDFLNQCSPCTLATDPTLPEGQVGECLSYGGGTMPDAGLTNPPPGTVQTVPAGSPPSTLCKNVAPPGGQVLYMTGSSNFPPLLEKLAPAISANAPGLTPVFKTTTSCAGVRSAYLDPANPTKYFPDHVIHDPASATATDGYAQYYDPTIGKLANCMLGPSGATVDVGESEIFPETCGITKDPVNVAETPGPILAILFVAPYKTLQRAISSEAAREVFGEGGLDPWTEPKLFYVRGAGTATLQMVARQIGVPPTKFWGIDQGTADAMAKNLVGQLDPAASNESIGILGADFYDRNRGGLKALAFQATDQLCAYTPDSNSNSVTLPRDKINVRDGHYPIWGSMHFFTVETDSQVSDAARTFVSLFGSPMIPMDMLDAFIDSGFVPDCAMMVDRDGELPGALMSRPPVYGCGCHFDSHVNPAPNFVPPTCVPCSDAMPCADTTKACHYGFCESQSL